MRPALRIFLVAGLTVSLAGCLFDERVLAPKPARVAVHAVLDPDASEFYVLLEEIRPGQEEDGIVTGARVVIHGPDGDSAIGSEQGPRGKYNFSNAPTPIYEHEIPIRRGTRYRLRVNAPGRPQLRASTFVPAGGPVGAVVNIRFNRDRDTMRLSWPAANGAKRYAVWISAVSNLFRIFVDGTSTQIDSRELRDISSDLYRPFVPGARQEILVTALDTNFSDWYQSETSPFTGTGLLSHVDGGTGVFGASVRVRHVMVRTVASQNEPIEGLFQRTDTQSVDAPQWIDLYVSEARFESRTITGSLGGDSLVEEGTLKGNYSSTDGSVVASLYYYGEFQGTLFGSDSIVGRFLRCGGGTTSDVVYVKRRTIP